MKKNTIWILVVIAVLAIALVLFLRPGMDVPEVELPDNDLEPVEVPTGIVVDLLEENDSGQSGTATIEDVNGLSRLVIEVTPDLLDVEQPAHIHFNNCADIGGVKYPLNNVINGRSETLINVSVSELLEERPLSINVHKSIPEASIYVACGDL